MSDTRIDGLEHAAGGVNNASSTSATWTPAWRRQVWVDGSGPVRDSACSSEQTVQAAGLVPELLTGPDRLVRTPACSPQVLAVGAGMKTTSTGGNRHRTEP